MVRGGGIGRLEDGIESNHDAPARVSDVRMMLSTINKYVVDRGCAIDQDGAVETGNSSRSRKWTLGGGDTLGGICVS